MKEEQIQSSWSPGGPPRIWIGGTGRSGTTLLYKLMGHHPDVHSFPAEMRFVVDPDGLYDLIDALTASFSTSRADDAWRKFRRLMLVVLDRPYRTPYNGFAFSRWLGSDYKKTVERFLEQLVRGTYLGRDFQTQIPLVQEWSSQLIRRLEAKKLAPRGLIRRLGDSPRRTQQCVRHFPIRAELTAIAGEFLDTLFLQPALREGKSTWCEKTPHNLLMADFLLELVPESKFVHVYRDPRGVAQSFARQSWSSSDLRTASRTVRDIYLHWFAVRERVDLSRTLEVELESFSDDPLESFNKVLDFLGLRRVTVLSTEVSSHQVNYWKESLGNSDLKIVNSELGDIVERLGYSV